MKLFLKKNKIAIVVYIVMVILIGLGVSDYQKENEYQKRLLYNQEFGRYRRHELLSNEYDFR